MATQIVMDRTGDTRHTFDTHDRAEVEKAERRVIAPEVRASGRVEIDERRQSTIAPKFEGYVERLHVNATGEQVAKGQDIFKSSKKRSV